LTCCRNSLTCSTASTAVVAIAIGGGDTCSCGPAASGPSSASSTARVNARAGGPLMADRRDAAEDPMPWESEAWPLMVLGGDPAAAGCECREIAMKSR